MNINRKLNSQYNHKRIYRLMKILGLKSVIRVKGIWQEILSLVGKTIKIL